MVLTPIASVPAGKQANLVFSHLMSEGSFHFGTEIPFGGSVAFELEGSLEGRMTLYDVKKSGNQINGAWLVELNPQYPPLGLSNPEIDDFCYNHDVLCGLGVFSSASSWLAMRTVTAVDWSSLALDAFKLNHQVFCLCEDVSSSCHCLQHASETAGVWSTTNVDSGYAMPAVVQARPSERPR